MLAALILALVTAQPAAPARAVLCATVDRPRGRSGGGPGAPRRRSAHGVTDAGRFESVGRRGVRRGWPGGAQGPAGGGAGAGGTRQPCVPRRRLSLRPMGGLRGWWTGGRSRRGVPATGDRRRGSGRVESGWRRRDPAARSDRRPRGTHPTRRRVRPPAAGRHARRPHPCAGPSGRGERAEPRDGARAGGRGLAVGEPHLRTGAPDRRGQLLSAGPWPRHAGSTGWRCCGRWSPPIRPIPRPGRCRHGASVPCGGRPIAPPRSRRGRRWRPSSTAGTSSGGSSFEDHSSAVLRSTRIAADSGQPRMTLAPGTRFGSYTILSALGAGGMGEVYRARDSKLERDVAIKVLRADVAGDRDRLARFGREARILAALNHPNIANVIGLEDATDTPALVMELVDGPTLALRIDGRRPAARRGARHRRPDRRGARGGARARRHPPRPEAGQRQGPRRRAGQGARFRPGQGARSRPPQGSPIRPTRRRSPRR